MTRFRLVSTLITLTVGAGMAASYMTPDTPAAPERIKPQAILPAEPPAPGTSLPALPADAAPAATDTAALQPSEPPTVALPSGPLLRSATGAPPIDTTAIAPAAPVRHEPGSEALRPVSLDVEEAEEAASPAPIARPAPRRTQPRPRSAHNSKKIESLFLNPLGTR